MSDAGDPDGERRDADGAGTEPHDADPDREAPLSDLAAEVERRREHADEDREEFDDLFSEESVGEVDRETLWAQVTAEEPTAGPGEGTAAAGRELRVVEKAGYCQGCPHFSDPPAVHCTHEGTEILEVADTDRFLVSNCPVVREDEELGDVSKFVHPEEYDGTLDTLGGPED